MTNKLDSKALALQICATADRQDWALMMDLVAPTAKVHIGSMDLDRDAWRGFGQLFYAAFPDAKHTIEQAHASGESATVVATIAATHRGEFMGVPATGKRISLQVIHVDRFVDGRCVEHTGQFDTAGLMQQLAGSAFDVRAFGTELFSRIDAQEFASALTLATPDFAFVIGGQRLSGPQWIEFSKAFYAAFPDGRHAHDEMVPAGDRGTFTGRFVGTHRGAFNGVPATGRSVSCSYVAIGRFAGGKIAELRVEIDSAGLMQQIM